ncbi:MULTISPECIES: hypothetical protein [unclassified Bradyrhizobium]|uniref:hypothetical protein n=1 Tax=unclassified Bradyrhizobium TaxID=2631580 RepID=UPI00291652C8|nr:MULTISPECIES: hypothetical protein [unclassified Bradyrhizobium]
MARNDETDEEIEFREENERQIALMIVDSLWQSQWIRGALQTYEYHGKGFDGYRQMFGRSPPDSQRPSISSMKWKLEEFVLRELRERQYEIYTHPKKNKRKVTAADVFKPHKREMNTYGLHTLEVSLKRDEWKAFENSASGRAELEAYCRANGVDPKDLLNVGYA